MGDKEDARKGYCSHGHHTSSDAQTRLTRKGYRNLDSGDGCDEADEESALPLGARTSRVGVVGVQMDYVQVKAAINEEDGEEQSSRSEIADGDKTTRHLALFGSLSVVHVVLQFWGSFAFRSLALLSDAFHNLFDVGAIGLASYTHRLQRKQRPVGEDGNGDTLPFGYKRAEVIGGLVNSVTLLSLSAYVILTAIPRLFAPTEVNSGWAYIGLGFAGVLVNLVGVMSFAASGEDGHSHAHDGGFLFAHSHSHGHGHGAREEINSDEMDASTVSSSCSPEQGDFKGRTEKAQAPCSPSQLAPAGLSRGGARMAVTDAALCTGDPVAAAREAAVDSDGAQGSDIEHHGACVERRQGQENDEEEFEGDEEAWVGDGGCVQAHREALPCDDGHNVRSFDHVCSTSGLCHRRRRSQSGSRCSFNAVDDFVPCNGHGLARIGVVDVAGSDHCDHHGHVYVHEDSSHAAHAHGHSHSHCYGHAEHGHGREHSHGHDHGLGLKDGGCGGGKSMNIWAVFVHALVDVISSALVCLQSALIYFLGSPDRLEWTDYLDPLASIGLSLFVMWTALPLIKECIHVLLEGTPRDVDLSRVKARLLTIPEVYDVSHLNIIQLNGRDPHVAIVRLVVWNNPSCGRHEGARRSLSLSADGGVDRDRVLGDVKNVLADFNVGQSTIEMVSWARGKFAEEARLGGNDGDGAAEGSAEARGEGRTSYGRGRGEGCRDRLEGAPTTRVYGIGDERCRDHPKVQNDNAGPTDMPHPLEHVDDISHDSSAVLV